MAVMYPNAGLYIHVPFCTSVCPYCDFAVTIAGEERRESYLVALEREAVLYSDAGFEFDTVYLGGGTPSALGIGQLERMLASIRRHLAIRDNAAVYLEVNPEDVTADVVRGWRRLGVGTVSLGVQSFDDEYLRFLGRRHSAASARMALELLQEGGFDTVSIDLIYGMDNQTVEEWRSQLAVAVSLGVDHLSCYQLTVHSDTVFGKRLESGRLSLQGESSVAEIFHLTHELLADSGYLCYEVSNFALAPDHRSRHNTKYWTHTPYLGLGPSAHSFARGHRWWNNKKLRLWERALAAGESPVDDDEELTVEQLVVEAVMLGLRTSDGIDIAALRREYGVDLMESNHRTIDEFVESGHLHCESGRLRPTTAGLAVADALARNLTTQLG